MIAPASLVWFARHELRLTWRETVMLLQGGRRGHGGWAILAIALFTIAMHVIAYGALQPSAEALRSPDKTLFLAMTGSAFLTWTLLLSQAMETVTRVFYARADLDLILSAPTDARLVFAIRLGSIAVRTIAMAVLLGGPVVDAMVLLGGARFLCAYGVLVAMGSTATAVAMGATAVLFRLAGPKRTRLLAQIVAAIVGAGFVVGIQVAAITSTGSLSRIGLFQSPAWVAAAPGLASPAWWPARAATGEVPALAAVLSASLALLAGAVAGMATLFAGSILRVAGLPNAVAAPSRRTVDFGVRSRAQVLRRKEWALLQRDPWLVSQSLMQVLYLLPPAVLLWRDFDTNIGGLVVLVPVLVMATGQLAGGLAWLAISGEDAPDLVATAPITGASVMRAKIEAVMIAVALPVTPIAIGMALMSPAIAGVTILGAALAAAGASAIQVFFKSQAKRSQFRRRQTASRIATFAEAFLSIAIAAGAGLAAAGLWLAVPIPALVAVGVLFAARLLTRPDRSAIA